MKSLPKLAPVIAFGLFLALPAGAEWKVTGQAMEFYEFQPNPSDEAVFNSLFQSNVIADIQNQLDNINSRPESLFRDYAAASAFSGASAGQRGYMDYSTAAFTIGPVLGAQLPESYLQAISGQAGINTGILPSMPFKGLYASLKFGYFKYGDADGYRFENLSLGLLANYQLFRGGNNTSAFQWRGVSVGAGFVWQRSEIEVDYELDELWFLFDVDNNSIDDFAIAYRSKLNLNMTANIFVIPLEVSTAVRLLGLVNLSAALGCDIAFGSNRLNIDTDDTWIDYFGFPGGSYPNPTLKYSGWLKVEVDGRIMPNIANPRLSCGLGFTPFGSLFVDIPFNWYFLTKGWSSGITAGYAW
jgi:hypothetical protein